MNLRGQTIAVTGAGGFIGSAAVAALHAAGAQVRPLLGPNDPPPAAATGLLHWRADIADEAALRRVFDGAACVLHLAGPPSVADSMQRPLEHARSHVLGTVQVLQACRALGIERLVYLSSAEVYGQPRGGAPVREDAPLAARSPYGASKVAAEQFIGAAAAAGWLRPVVLRPFSVYGPGMSGASLIGGLLQQAVHGPCLSVHDLRPVRDFCHIDDLLCALRAACVRDAGEPRCFNIGSGVGSSVQAVVDTVRAAVRSVRRLDLPVVERADGRRRGSSEILNLVADVGLARQHLGWQPSLTLQDGLYRLVVCGMREADSTTPPALAVPDAVAPGAAQ